MGHRWSEHPRSRQQRGIRRQLRHHGQCHRRQAALQHPIQELPRLAAHDPGEDRDRLGQLPTLCSRRHQRGNPAGRAHRPQCTNQLLAGVPPEVHRSPRPDGRRGVALGPLWQPTITPARRHARLRRRQERLGPAHRPNLFRPGSRHPHHAAGQGRNHPRIARPTGEPGQVHQQPTPECHPHGQCHRRLRRSPHHLHGQRHRSRRRHAGLFLGLRRQRNHRRQHQPSEPHLVRRPRVLGPLHGQ